MLPKQHLPGHRIRLLAAW